MKTNVFVKTKNVKRFVGLMEDLKKHPPNIPKLLFYLETMDLVKQKRCYGGQQKTMRFTSEPITILHKMDY